MCKIHLAASQDRRPQNIYDVTQRNPLGKEARLSNVGVILDVSPYLHRWVLQCDTNCDTLVPH